MTYFTIYKYTCVLYIGQHILDAWENKIRWIRIKGSVINIGL